ncbi:SCO6745 family protein [Micromonospora sp. NPDC004704]
MTPEQAAAAAGPSITALVGAFGESPQTQHRARVFGLSGWAFQVAGRGGVLGDVAAETVAATLGFLAPDAVAEGWEAARRVARPTEVAASNLAECCRWGTERLHGFPKLDRLVELTSRVVEDADATGMPLFAAWRAVPPPVHDPAGRMAVLLYLLREHYSAAHLIAVRVAGLTPLEAVLAGPDGEAGALANGWQPPYPQVAPLIRRRLWADAVTDKLAATGFRNLRGSERIELVDLLGSLRTGLT